MTDKQAIYNQRYADDLIESYNRQYATTDHPCRYGHFNCATRDGGSCSTESWLNLEKRYEALTGHNIEE